MRLIVILAFMSLTGVLPGQEVVFKVEVSADTLFFGNRLGIKYTIENTQGDFDAPEFEGFRIVGGPNVSSQFSMVNGEISQSSTYEYVLVPFELGEYQIPPASLQQGDQLMYSQNVSISVVENPDEIRQNHRSYGSAREVFAMPEQKKMSPEDSLKMKLRKIKSKKI